EDFLISTFQTLYPRSLGAGTILHRNSTAPPGSPAAAGAILVRGERVRARTAASGRNGPPPPPGVLDRRIMGATRILQPAGHSSEIQLLSPTDFFLPRRREDTKTPRITTPFGRGTEVP